MYHQNDYVIDYLKMSSNFKHIFLSYYSNQFILCKFRSGSHRIPVETGRWKNISRNDRFCHL